MYGNPILNVSMRPRDTTGADGSANQVSGSESGFAVSVLHAILATLSQSSVVCIRTCCESEYRDRMCTYTYPTQSAVVKKASVVAQMDDEPPR
jgi:hypothetical protein